MTGREEIGSDFYEYNTETERYGSFWFEHGYNVEYLKSGRNAIKALARLLNKKKVLLPAYTCETVIQPFVDEGYDISYFVVNRDLAVNTDSLKSEIEHFKPDILLVHSYFGLDTLNEAERVLEEAKESGVIIVEDITQSLFSSHFLSFADYYVSSLRKFFAIPDGGVLISKNPLDVEHGDSDRTIEDVARKAFEKKRSYFNSDALPDGDLAKLKDAFRADYAKLQELINENSRITRISELSKEIYDSLDIEDTALQRVGNYNCLRLALHESDVVKPILPEVSVKQVPLYLPVYVLHDRKELQQFLADKRIYCPIIWGRPAMLSEFRDVETDYIYEHILCIPVDQRYGVHDMMKIVEAIKEYKANCT